MNVVPTFRKPRWRDPRLGVGILLVAVSVALGGWVFAQADKTSPVFVAGAPIAVGDTLAGVELQVVDLNLGATSANYLDPHVLADQYPWPEQLVFHQAIPAGELIPLSTLGAAAELGYRPISIVVTNQTPIDAGDVVDVWLVTQEIGAREAGEPELIASKLHVRGVANEESLFAGGASHVVHVLVPEEEVGKVLGALATTGQVTLVPHLGNSS